MINRGFAGRLGLREARNGQMENLLLILIGEDGRRLPGLASHCDGGMRVY
jgi:hypothetical protein